MKMNKTVVAITGGHSTGIALIEEITKRHPLWNIVYLGRKSSLEGNKAPSFESVQLAKNKLVSFVPITTGRLQRRFTISTIPSLLKIPIGFIQSLIVLAKSKPDITISFGGYISTPVVISSWLLNIPVITHEQTSSMGLANKINSLFAKKIAVSFPGTLKSIAKNKGIYTGNLILDMTKNKTNPGSLERLNQYVNKTGKPILYITGGKTGSRYINQLVEKTLSLLTKDFMVVHQTGDLEFSKYQALKQEKYLPISTLPTLEQGWLLNNAKLVVSRGGANIIFELATIKKPAIIIPIPWSSGNEQLKNGKFLESINLAICLDQEKLTPKIFLENINRLSLDVSNKKMIPKTESIKNGREQLLKEIEIILDEKKTTKQKPIG